MIRVSDLALIAGDTPSVSELLDVDREYREKAAAGGVVRSSNKIFQAPLDFEQLTQPLIDLAGLLDRKLRHERCLGYLEYRVRRINLAFTQRSIKIGVHSTRHGWTSVGFPAALDGD